MRTILILLIIAASRPALAQADPTKLSRFKAETNLLAKHMQLRDLAASGGDEVFLAFKESLLGTNLNRKLQFKEEAFMLGLVGCMGSLARTSNIAGNFLVTAVNPQFWKTNISWTTDLGEREYSVLAGYALTALAVSGRREFETIAEQVKRDPSMGGNHHGLAGHLVEAYFHKQLVQGKGWETVRSLNPEQISWEFRKWIKTPEGTNHYAWLLSVEHPQK